MYGWHSHGGRTRLYDPSVDEVFSPKWYGRYLSLSVFVISRKSSKVDAAPNSVRNSALSTKDNLLKTIISCYDVLYLRNIGKKERSFEV